MSITEVKPISRHEILRQIRDECGDSEETEILIDYIEDLWETIDLLRKRFREERAQEIINTPTPAPFTYSDED